MSDLSERQEQLLKAIIELYVKTGEPISSDLIEKSYALGVSPATIRNDMVKLTTSGYLKQPHTSSGRVPTSQGFRLYINELMKLRELPVLDEVSIRQQVMDQKAQFDQTIEAATRALSKKCLTLALSVNNNDVYYAGAAYILDRSEFFDIDVTRFVLSLFDDVGLLLEILAKAHGEDEIHVLFGEETGFEYLRPTSFAFLDFDNGTKEKGVIGVIGPDRLNFPVVIPYLRYIGEVLSEAGRNLAS